MKIYLKYLILLLFYHTSAQVDSNYVVKFHFDEWEQGDSLTKKAKIVGVASCNDRFGNKNSAYYFYGADHSYINLGVSSNLKPKVGSISLWFRADEVVANGHGYMHNVIILTKSWEGDDFYEGYNINYSYLSKRVMGAQTYSEEGQVTIKSTDTIVMGKWYHAVLTFGNKYVCFYLDAVLQGKVARKLPPRYLVTDSVMLGNSANQKNLRFFNGCIDDVEIYQRVLSPEEVLRLYQAPNPNRYAVLKKWIWIICAIMAFVFACVLLVKARIKFVLKKEKEKTSLQLHALEQEIKMLKAQMDPHFIFNSLNTILQFIIIKENEKAELYLTKFSKLIRKLLESNTKECIRLADELDILNKYLEIEALRFDESIVLEIKLNDNIDANTLCIPHMMIQPFVENAIWHGLRLKKGEKQLRISFELINEKCLLCAIDDNGIGRSEQPKENRIEKDSSLAINFIQQRLDLMSKLNDVNYTLNIFDKKNIKGESEGTHIEIKLPIIKK